jgi:stage III sporulation protein AF
MGLAGAAVLCGIATTLTPPGPVRRVTRMICGAAMALALISPVAKLDMDVYARSMTDYRTELEEITGAVEESSDRLSRAIIQEELAAYILDKARVLGFDAGQVEITVKWGGDCLVSDEAYLKIPGTGSQRNALSAVLEAELGITAERQHWNEDIE